jgi:hypothetical protein
MTKHLSKLEIKEVSSVETFTDLQQSSSTEFDLAKQNISNLKKDAFETAECLASINNTIKEHLARMEKIKKLDFNF